jgi:tetratricopeptide (TPR) repeat protein
MSGAALQAKFKAAIALHGQGKLAEAAKLYDEIIGQDKAHFAALHGLGAIAYQTGNLQKSVDLISRAVQINPGIAAGDPYRSAALNQLGRHEEALAVCNEAIKLKPDFVEAHYNRANALYGLGRLEEALTGYTQATAIRPNFAEAWANRGNTLQALGRFAEALASSDRATLLQPNYAQGWYNRGNALYDLGRLEEALSSYQRAIELRPGQAQAWYNRGKVLADLKRRDEAIASYDRAVAINPAYAQAWCNRGNVLNDQERFEDALASYDKALALKPDYAEAWSNRGTALQYLYRLEEALTAHDKALALKPDYAEAHCNRGSVINTLGRPEEALVSFNRAIALKPDFAQAHFNKAITELGLGNMQAGWRDFEWRRKIVEMSGTRVFPKPLLTPGANVEGKTILVHFEHGLGDTLHFYRYLELLHQAGAKILFNVQKKLRRLLTPRSGYIQFAELDDPTLQYDYQIPMMSLPWFFQTTVQTIPATVPYVEAEDGLVQSWRERLGTQGFKIGICWMGSVSHMKGGDRRCFPVTSFESLSKLRGVRLISLQKAEEAAELKTLPPGMAVESFDDMDAGPDAFIDTAAIMKNLDLVITNDTSVSHLAGALGVPTWVALQQVADWRWLREREDSPWYPSLRLFRQKTDGDWAGVFAEIRAALAEKIS